jgi:hypothetical protein
MTKCVVTGHTSGIGKAIYNRFENLGFEMIGVSRRTEYDIEENYDTFLELARSCDIVINNAYCNDIQLRILNDLNGIVPNIITLGSIAGYYYQQATAKKQYCYNKQQLIETTKKLSLTSSSNLLLINVGLTENSSPTPCCTFTDIADVCEFWIKMPRFNLVDFNLKLSDMNVELIEYEFGVTKNNII